MYNKTVILNKTKKNKEITGSDIYVSEFSIFSFSFFKQAIRQQDIFSVLIIRKY